MPSRTRITIFIAFLLSLAVWVGGGVFDSIASHPAWYADPVAYVRSTAAPPNGTINPWPFTTAFIALCTLAGLAAFARYRGPGRRHTLVVLLTVFAVLVVTGVYFVPTLVRLADHASYSDAQITSMSLTWMRLNVMRILLLLGMFVYALLGLMRMGQARPAAS